MYGYKTAAGHSEDIPRGLCGAKCGILNRTPK
jgi:hypothetical protein